MRLRVTAVEPHPNDHNRTVITMECEASPIAVKQGMVVAGEALEASRRGNSLLAEVHIPLAHGHADLPPGRKRVVNTAQSILESGNRDDTQ